MKTIYEIITEYLKKNGFDGLYNLECECGCFLDDLSPCGNQLPDCIAGIKKVRTCGCDDCEERENCDSFGEYGGGEECAMIVPKTTEVQP